MPTGERATADASRWRACGASAISTTLSQRFLTLALSGSDGDIPF